MKIVFFCLFIDVICFFAYLCTRIYRKAQMAELVDALVSNTSGVKPVPVRSRFWAPLRGLP